MQNCLPLLKCHLKQCPLVSVLKVYSVQIIIYIFFLLIQEFDFIFKSDCLYLFLSDVCGGRCIRDIYISIFWDYFLNTVLWIKVNVCTTYHDPVLI
jgi:hypothetical protein